VALVPLLVALGSPTTTRGGSASGWASAHRALRYGLVAGIVWFIGTLYWLTDVMVTYGGLSTPLAAFAAFLLIAYLALFPAAAIAVTARACSRFGAEGLLVAPAAWVAGEYLRGHLLTGFPWVPLGNSQIDVASVAQAASVVGIYGLSGLVALPAAVAVYAWHRQGRARTVVVAGAAIVLAGTAWWGHQRLADGSLLRAGASVRVGLVQGNVEQGQKWNPALASEIFSRYLDLSRDAVRRGARLVLWPESSTPFMFEESPALADAIRALARESQTTMLIGSDQVERDTPPRYYNSAFLIRPDGTVADTYRKTHLVPFGEYVPFQKIFSFASPLVEAAGAFSEGTRITVFPIAGGSISTAICYEVVFPELARGAVLGGSRLLSTITNDAWYGRTSAPWQHFDQARMRAIEQGRFLVRAANTGISGIVDPYGRVVQRSAIFEPAVVVGEVRLLEGLTAYARMGDALAYACLLLCALVSLWPLRPARDPLS
jgi:apolipoprotein N-acyltransferase